MVKMKHRTSKDWISSKGLLALFALAIILSLLHYVDCYDQRKFSRGGGGGGGGNRRIPCPSPELLLHGKYIKKRQNGVIIRVQCDLGYERQGPRFIECVHGRWYGEKPVCAKRGCKTRPPKAENSYIEIDQDNIRAMVYCSADYTLAGNRFAYCNGTDWDRPLGNCRERSFFNVQHECDFETEDICGWVHEPSMNYEWKRVMPGHMFTSSFTGPRHDHTTMNSRVGHYMLMESLSSEPKKLSLTSPIYDSALSRKNSCFRFYYFMYGAGVGDLAVYIRPISVSMTDVMADEASYLKFKKSGNQNNLWNEGKFNIEFMDTDFQIVFVASSGTGHFGDIAIDDVKLMTGNECKKSSNEEESDNETTTAEIVDSKELFVFDTQSCRGRCSQSTQGGFGYTMMPGKLFENCNCHLECEDDDSCCPDYRVYCLAVLATEENRDDDATFATIIEASVEETTLTIEESGRIQTAPTAMATSTVKVTTKSTSANTTTSTTTITISTATTTRKPTTTTTTRKPTTTTTTRKPTTSTTKTTTTRKPTTTTTRKPITTTTTTTTRKPTTTRTTTTTTKKPTTKTTTTTKKPTPTTTTTALKPRITTRTKSTSTTTPTPPTTSTTNMPSTKIIKLDSELSNSSTTKSSVEHSRKDSATTASFSTPSPIVWLVDEHNSDSSRIQETSQGARVLRFTFIFIICCVLLAALYHRHARNIAIWYAARKNAENDSQSGDVETSSITATFINKETTKLSKNGNGCSNGTNGRAAVVVGVAEAAPETSSTRFVGCSSKPNKKRKAKKTSHFSGDMSAPLWQDDDNDDLDDGQECLIERRQDSYL